MELTWSLALTVKPRQTSWPKRFSHHFWKIFMTQNLSIFLAFCMLYGNVRATNDRLDGTPEIKTKILIATFSVLYSHIVGNIKSKISKTIPGLRSWVWVLIAQIGSLTCPTQVPHIWQLCDASIVFWTWEHCHTLGPSLLLAGPGHPSWLLLVHENYFISVLIGKYFCWVSVWLVAVALYLVLWIILSLITLAQSPQFIKDDHLLMPCLLNLNF